MARRVRTHLGGDDMTPTGLKTKHLTKLEFGRRLYRLIIERGWSQSELARRADMPRDSISTYINGKSFPAPGSVKKLAAALEIRPEELLPNHVEAAIDEDPPDIELRRSPGDTKHAWLRINRLVPYTVGLDILRLLDDTDAATNDD